MVSCRGHSERNQTKLTLGSPELASLSRSSPSLVITEDEDEVGEDEVVEDDAVEVEDEDELVEDKIGGDGDCVDVTDGPGVETTAVGTTAGGVATGGAATAGG